MRGKIIGENCMVTLRSCQANRLNKAAFRINSSAKLFPNKGCQVYFEKGLTNVGVCVMQTACLVPICVDFAVIPAVIQ